MKKLTTVLAVVAILMGSTAFANTGDKVTKVVQTAFENNFSGALNVTWEQSEDFYFASFELNKKKVNAAYNEKGELVGISRKLQLSEIPLNVSQALHNEFADYTILNSVTEMLYEGQTYYYATAENASRTLKLKCFSSGQVEIEKKIKK